MWIPKRALLALSLAATIGLSLALAVGAFGDHGGRHGRALVRDSLAPSVPADPPFHGVMPGASSLGPA